MSVGIQCKNNLHLCLLPVKELDDAPAEDVAQAQPKHRKSFLEGSVSTADKLLQNLSNNVQRTGRAMDFEVKRILRHLVASGSCEPSQALLLLRCCGSILTDVPLERRRKLVEEAWTFFDKAQVPLTSVHYNALLKIYLENENDFVPAQFLAEMEAKSLKPDRLTYQYLTARYCEMGDLSGKPNSFMRWDLTTLSV